MGPDATTSFRGTTATKLGAARQSALGIDSEVEGQSRTDVRVTFVSVLPRFGGTTATVLRYGSGTTMIKEAATP